MKQSYEIPFFMLSYGRSFADDEGELIIDRMDAAIWSAAKIYLRSHKIAENAGVSEITIDWTPVLKAYTRRAAVTKHVLGGGPQDIGRRMAKARYPRRKIKVRVQVERDIEPRLNKFASENGARHIATTVLYDVFLMMNLATPGSCDFYKAELISNEYSDDISLSNYIFETSFSYRNRKGWPEIKVISLERVVAWFGAVRSGVNQLPSTPVEKALFALFHLAQPDLDPLSVIWVFYALESLLQTRVGESFSLIFKRLLLLFDMNEVGAKILRKELRALYDFRSAIVHGGLEVIHPLNNDILDKRAHAVYSEMLDRINYGTALVISALQRMVDRGWTQLSFDENLVGGSNIEGYPDERCADAKGNGTFISKG